MSDSKRPPLVDLTATLKPLDVRLRTHSLRLDFVERAVQRKVERGERSELGPAGPAGPPGPAGPMPAHEWEGTSLRFENPDGSWGAFTDLQGPRGKRGADGYGGVTVVSKSNWFPGGW